MHVRLSAVCSRHRKRWADGHPDLNAWRAGQPAAGGVKTICAENHTGNDPSASQPSERRRATLGCGAFKNGSNARANATFGKHSHHPPSAQPLHPEPQCATVRPRTVYRKGIDRTKPGRCQRVGVEFLASSSSQSSGRRRSRGRADRNAKCDWLRGPPHRPVLRYHECARLADGRTDTRTCAQWSGKQGNSNSSPLTHSQSSGDLTENLERLCREVPRAS